MSRRQIRELILRHAPAHGTADTAIEGLQLIRVTRPVPLAPSVYPAALCFLVDGTKRVYLGGEIKTYGEGSFLCCAMPLPVEAEVPQATLRRPVLGLLLRLDTTTMSETLVAAEATGHLEPVREPAAATPGLVVAPSEGPLEQALWRLLLLLDDPCGRQVLTASRLREVYFALLRSEAGRVVRRAFGASRDLGRAFAYVHEHLHEPISIDALARVAGMSKPVFHRRFKAATSLSPLQFIKAIRLNNAAALIAGGMNVAEAATEVGYGSASQFSREFSRHYGMSPRRWANEAGPHAAAAG